MDKINYLSLLNETFPGANFSGVVLNEKFSSFEDRIWEKISKNVRDLNYVEEDNELLVACQSHADKYSNFIEDNSVICLVHPFHLAFRHLPLLNQESKKEFDKYLLNLNELLTHRGSKKIIVLDTAHTYAAFTSLLLENKTIDEVIFTSPEGLELNKDSNSSRSHYKNFFLAGGYYKKQDQDPGFLLEAKHFLEKHHKKVYAIEGLILNSPDSFSQTGYLLPNRKQLNHFTPFFSIQKRIFSLDDVLNTNNLKNLMPKNPLNFFGLSY